MSELILALETSSSAGSVALLDGNKLITQEQLEEGLRHGRSLLPAAENCLRAAGIGVADLAVVAVGKGPGSYTGTRIGVMAAKALAFGGNVPLVGVSSLAALAWDAMELGRCIIPAQDARRDEVYSAVYRISPETDASVQALLPERPVSERPDVALTPEECAALATGAGCVIVGSAVSKYADVFQKYAPDGTNCSEMPMAPSAMAVGLLAWRRWKTGEQDDPLALQPVYLRRD